ncbi:phosphonate ABC transporter ATP-binding protein [Zoogloea dura]|jgi:phosphonate transport system ATP-binding protein|uniref:ATP-binding cassette domain-containing protein n=1 Tax=Zoogloea dura TaxID=2728840 RepID=A0A848G2C4_9RHOO|nr:ATP-binding cassette domain-containing protein [Zoogloea dura]NML25206.1 ATP-binding cassette domain-containing protein [Zoogloea dura]
MGFSLKGVGLTHANGFRALRDVDLRVACGERVALVGASGAGKTTLLRVLAAALRPDTGRLSLLGTDPWDASPATLRRLRARIGLVHQAPPIPPRQRVVTAVLAGRLGQWPLWKSLASLLYPLDPEGARHQLARLDLGERLYERCDRLSGGQLQRVALARVLYQQPDLFLADEPVSAMDPALSELTVALLNEEASRRGVTLVASLHAVDLALRHFPRVIGVKEGQVLFDLPAGQVREAQLRELYAAEGSVPMAGLAVLPDAGQPAAAAPPPLRCA